MVAELRNTPMSAREGFLNKLQSLGIEGRGVSRFTDTLFGGSERNPIGFLDLIPFIGGGLAMERGERAAERGDYFDAAIEGLSVLPYGIGKAAKKPLGSLKAVLLDRGKKSGEPTFAIVDEFDNSVPTTMSGQVYGDNYGGISVNSAVPEPQEVYDLLDQGIITKKQAHDALYGPQLPNSALSGGVHRAQEFHDDLLLRGLKPGNAVRSGTVFGTGPEKLRLIGAIAQSQPLRNLKGSFTGTRVTGGKRGVRADIPLETARQAARKRGIGPPENRTIPEVPDIGGYLDNALSRMGRNKTALAKGKPGPRTRQQLDDDDFVHHPDRRPRGREVFDPDYDANVQAGVYEGGGGRSTPGSLAEDLNREQAARTMSDPDDLMQELLARQDEPGGLRRLTDEIEARRTRARARAERNQQHGIGLDELELPF